MPTYNARIETPAVGGEANFPFSFGYLEEAHVKISINDVVDTSATLQNQDPDTGGEIVPSIGINAADAVVVYRETPSGILVDFVTANRLTEADLDTTYRHSLYISEEAEDTASIAEMTAGSTTANVDAAVLATAADVVTTNANVVLTGLDVATTHADVVTTTADTVQTALDVIAAAASAASLNTDELIQRDGSVVMTGELTTSGAPTAGLSAANKTYVDTKIPLSGGTVTGSLLLDANTEEDEYDQGTVGSGTITIAKTDSSEHKVTLGGSISLDITAPTSGYAVDGSIFITNDASTAYGVTVKYDGVTIPDLQWLTNSNVALDFSAQAVSTETMLSWKVINGKCYVWHVEIPT